MTLMLQNNKTRGREVKGNLLGRYRQRGPRWKTNGSLDWFSLFQAFRCTFSWNIVASGSNWRTRMKRNGEGISLYPWPPLPTSDPLAAYPESRGPSIPSPLSSQRVCSESSWVLGLYSQLGATRLVGYLPSHIIQRALARIIVDNKNEK